MGAYQPGHTVAEEGDPRGAVHTYRMALWAAHLCGTAQDYANPGSDLCLEKVRQVGVSNSELFLEFNELK